MMGGGVEGGGGLYAGTDQRTLLVRFGFGGTGRSEVPV